MCYKEYFNDFVSHIDSMSILKYSPQYSWVLKIWYLPNSGVCGKSKNSFELEEGTKFTSFQVYLLSNYSMLHMRRKKTKTTK